MALGVGTLKFEMLSDEELFGNWDKPVTSDQKPILEAAAAQTPDIPRTKGFVYRSDGCRKIHPIE